MWPTAADLGAEPARRDRPSRGDPPQALRGDGGYGRLSGSRFGSITSWSMTTDVSSKPLVGSDIEALIDHSIYIDTKLPGVDPRRMPAGVGHRGARHEPVGPERPKLRDGRSVSRDDQGSARLHFTKDSRRVVAQFALGNQAVHRGDVAHVA